MANWLTIKQLSAKRGVAESTLRSWITLGYITSSTIDDVVMLDDESLTYFLDAHQTLGLDKDSLNQQIKEKEQECEIILSRLDDELFLLKTQGLYQPLFHTLIQELGHLITNDTHREIFLSISSGEPISRVAARHQMTYPETTAIYSSILEQLGKNPSRIATYRDRVLKFLYGKYDTDIPTNLPLTRLIGDRACHILHKQHIFTVEQLLSYTSRKGWASLKRLEGMGSTTYNEIINSLYNANFITLHEDKSIELTSEMATFVI